MNALVPNRSVRNILRVFLRYRWSAGASCLHTCPEAACGSSIAAAAVRMIVTSPKCLCLSRATAACRHVRVSDDAAAPPLDICMRRSLTKTFVGLQAAPHANVGALGPSSGTCSAPSACQLAQHFSCSLRHGPRRSAGGPYPAGPHRPALQGLRRPAGQAQARAWQDPATSRPQVRRCTCALHPVLFESARGDITDLQLAGTDLFLDLPWALKPMHTCVGVYVPQLPAGFGVAKACSRIMQWI